MTLKFLIFICFVSILFLCEKALGELIIKDVTIEPNASTKYKLQGNCSYSLFALVIDDSSPSQLSIYTDSKGLGFNVYAFIAQSYKNSTYSSSIFSISVSSYNGEGEPVLIASNNIVNSTLNMFR
ncbi:hypothetical protein ACTFIY_003132 [Dictyostelium cf. discoideum]